MESIFDYLNFVNEQAAFHERKAAEFQGDRREWIHKKTGQKFRALQKEIESLRNATILRQIPGSNPLALNSADVQGLPTGLLDQLVNLPDNDKLETDVVDIINEAGGRLLLDHLMITLYRRTGEVHQRSQLVSKLYRMNKKGLVYSTSKKGVYTTIKPAPEEEVEIPEEQTASMFPEK